jgi:hypothetical protein
VLDLLKEVMLAAGLERSKGVWLAPPCNQMQFQALQIWALTGHLMLLRRSTAEQSTPRSHSV